MPTIELDFLTDDERECQLARQYWQLDERGAFRCSVATLGKDYGLSPSSVLSRVARSCVAFDPEQCCPRCSRRQPFASRADYTSRRSHDYPKAQICLSCRDRESTERERGKVQQASDLRARVQAELDQRRAFDLQPDELSVTDAMYLLSVVRAGGAEDLTYICPQDMYREQLSPTIDLDLAILNELCAHHVLCVHPGSRSDTILQEENGYRFYPLRTHWILPLPENGPSPARFIQAVEQRVRAEAWPLDEWSGELASLHRTIALQECLQYLQLKLEEHGFELHAGEKTTLTLKSILERFTIGQTYNFIWRSAKDAAAFYQRGSVSKAHAANTVPGTMQRLAERAVAEGWDVKSYRRDRNAPESALSQLVLTAVLKLPDGGLASVAPPDANGY